MMKIGINFTSSETLPLIKRLIAEGKVDYCELLIDNFFHVPVRELAEAFDCPVAFHIILSRFIESDTDFLTHFATRVRALADALQPLYISDHLAHFSVDGRQVYALAEIDYAAERRRVVSRIAWWQAQLQRPLLLENFASLLDGGHDVPAFFEHMMAETGAGLLFDASNAVCAHRNCGAPLDRWAPLIRQASHFQVAGYTDEPGAVLTLDLHATPLAGDTLAFLRQHRADFAENGATLTYERDAQFDYPSIVADLQALRSVFAAPPIVAANAQHMKTPCPRP